MTSFELTLALSIGLIGAVALARHRSTSIRHGSRARKIASVLSGTEPETARDAAYRARIEYEVSRELTSAEQYILACCRAAREIR